MAFQEYFRNKRVFLTGHTGFKGSWLAEWLLYLGAEVHGYALDPQPHERLFNQLSLASRLSSDIRADLADRVDADGEHRCGAKVRHRLRIGQKGDAVGAPEAVEDGVGVGGGGVHARTLARAC